VVILDDGAVVPYGKLLLATGGSPIRPPMDGAAKAGVLSFTTQADALTLLERMDKVGRRVVVIGAGLIGAACSDALARIGVRPVVVELRARPLSLLLDAPGSELVQEAMAKAGVELICNNSVKEVLGRPDDPDSVGGVVLADGRRIECDVVVVAIGVRPRLSLASDAGLHVNRGIVVDDRMATSDPDVFACGDVAEAYDCVLGSSRVVPIWPGAFRGGRVAGLNMAGRDAHFDDSTVMNSLKYFGLTLVSAGEINVEGPDGQTMNGYAVTRKLDRRKGTYRKIVQRGGRLAGFVFAGAIERSGIVNWLLRERHDISSFSDRLVDERFDLIDLPADLRRAHYLEATSGEAQAKTALSAPVAARAPKMNGGMGYVQ
jgi:NAD(P)H-nitrite reductase large subunit